MKENRKLLREVLKDIRHDMTDEEVLNLLADRECLFFVGAASGSSRAPTIWKRSFMAAPPLPARPARRGCAGRSAR